MEKISNILPHRYPFLLVDKVVHIEPNKSVVALKNVSINEPYFVGHFPGQPVMPGVLQVEAIAQAACILCFSSDNFSPDTHLAYLAGIEEAKFRRMVVPGDRLMLRAEIIRSKRGIFKIAGTAMVDDEIACEATITAVVQERKE